MKSKKVKLVPPDPKRCQANNLEGAWPDAQHFMIIGPRRLVRCSNVPSCLVYELKAAADGLKGSMSLCPEHLEEFKQKRDLRKYRFKQMKP